MSRQQPQFKCGCSYFVPSKRAEMLKSAILAYHKFSSDWIQARTRQIPWVWDLVKYSLLELQ
eukprot:scaffold557999_cov15-Prasinocladus_malaysianus.AAC.1